MTKDTATGNKTRYLFYPDSGKTSVTIPRLIIEAGKLDWKHRDIISITIEEIEGKRGIFLVKEEDSKTEAT